MSLCGCSGSLALMPAQSLCSPGWVQLTSGAVCEVRGRGWERVMEEEEAAGGVLSVQLTPLRGFSVDGLCLPPSSTALRTAFQRLALRMTFWLIPEQPSSREPRPSGEEELDVPFGLSTHQSSAPSPGLTCSTSQTVSPWRKGGVGSAPAAFLSPRPQRLHREPWTALCASLLLCSVSPFSLECRVIIEAQQGQ